MCPQATEQVLQLDCGDGDGFLDLACVNDYGPQGLMRSSDGCTPVRVHSACRGRDGGRLWGAGWDDLAPRA